MDKITMQMLQDRAVAAEERARFEAEVARQAHVRACDATLRLEAGNAELEALARQHKLAEAQVRELEDELTRTKDSLRQMQAAARYGAARAVEQAAGQAMYLKQRLEVAEGREKAAQYQIADLLVRAEAAEARAEAAEARVAEAEARARGPA